MAFPYVKATDKTYWSGNANKGIQYNHLVENIYDLSGLDPNECKHIFDSFMSISTALGAVQK